MGQSLLHNHTIMASEFMSLTFPSTEKNTRYYSLDIKRNNSLPIKQIYVVNNISRLNQYICLVTQYLIHAIKKNFLILNICKVGNDDFYRPPYESHIMSTWWSRSLEPDLGYWYARPSLVGVKYYSP